MDYYRNIDKLGVLAYADSYKAKGIQYTVLTDLATEPVTLEFFKEHARIDFDTDDNLITSYVKAARQELERWTQLSFGIKTIRLTALELPTNYKLMHGRVDAITTADYTNIGDLLKEGGTDVVFEYTTLNWIDEVIKIAICRYAAGLYINRETITNSKFSGQVSKDEAKEMLRPYMNIIL